MLHSNCFTFVIKLKIWPENKVYDQSPTWINGTTNDPPQWIPCPVIKPIMKLIKPFFCQEAGGTVVEVPEDYIKVKLRHNFKEANL